MNAAVVIAGVLLATAGASAWHNATAMDADLEATILPQYLILGGASFVLGGGIGLLIGE